MMDLPSNLRDDCYKVLRNCDEFKSHPSLRTVFDVTELSDFQDFIPEADNLGDRVQQLISFMLKRKLEDGRPAFPFFLETLRNRYDVETELNGQLAQLLKAIQALEQPAQSGSSLSPRQQQERHQKLQQELNQKLLTLDFQLQFDRFWDVIDQHQIAAFLVHGPPLHGQRLLARRLIRFREAWATGRLVMIDATLNGVAKKPDALWSQVAAQLNMKDQKDKQLLADKVCEWWKTQTVIFVLPIVEYIPPYIVAAWLDEFWKPIVATARRQQALIPTDTHLLLFLVDIHGHVSKGVTLVDQPGELVHSHTALMLPPTGKVEEQELKTWILAAAGLFPRKVDAMTWIRDTEGGTPELLYAKIFEFCGLDWEGVQLP